MPLSCALPPPPQSTLSSEGRIVLSTMEFDGFDEEFLHFSPIDNRNWWPSSPPPSPARHPIPGEDGDDVSDESSIDEDGLHNVIAPRRSEDDCSEDGFGDDEQVIVASDQYSWKIDHAKGDHKFKGTSRCILKLERRE